MIRATDRTRRSVKRDVRGGKGHRMFPRRTQSLCPEYLAAVDMILYDEDGRALMKKYCPVHGTFTELIRSDATFFRLLMELMGSAAQRLCRGELLKKLHISRELAQLRRCCHQESGPVGWSFDSFVDFLVSSITRPPDGRFSPFCRYSSGPCHRLRVEERFAVPLRQYESDGDEGLVS